MNFQAYANQATSYANQAKTLAQKEVAQAGKLAADAQHSLKKVQKKGFKSIGLSVDAVSSDSDSDSDDGNENKKGDNLMLDSAKFMRNLTKVTQAGIFGRSEAQQDGGDSDDEMVGFGVEEQSSGGRRGNPGRGLSSEVKSANYAKDRVLSDMLEGNLDFDLDIDDDGVIVDNNKREEEERRRVKEKKKKMGGSGDNIGEDRQQQGGNKDEDEEGGDGNDSESGSEIGFGGEGDFNDGVPIEKYKALEMRLVAVVKKVKTSRKEFKDMRKKFRKADKEVVQFKQENEELNKEVVELDAKLQEAYTNQGGQGGGGGGGGGGAGGAALEEQRRKQREDARKALFAGGGDDDDEGVFHVNVQDMSFIKDLIIRVTKYINKRMPLAADIRTVQGHFGSSVASFFSFYRWIIITNVWAGILCLVFLILHFYSLYQVSYENIFTFYLLLPGFMATSSYGTADRYQYLALIMLLPMILFFDAIRKWINEDANSKIITSIEAEQANIKFAKQFLCCWDHGLTLNTDVEDLMCTIGSNMNTMIAVEKEKGKTLERSFNEKVKLFAKRSLGILMYICLLLASWASILYLKAQSEQVAEKLASYIEGAAYLSTSIVPGAVTVINAIVPMVIDKITKFESWDSEKTVQNVLLMKMYLAKILMVLIQFVSNLFLGDPILFTSSTSTYFGYDMSQLADAAARYKIRKNLETPFDSASFNCRLDQVGASFIQIVTVDFVLSKVIALGTSYAMTLKSKIQKKDFKREEFTVSKKMVNLLYFQGLIFLTISYAPLFTFIILVFQYSSFKFEKVMLFKFGTKPKKEWKAQDAGNFFIKFYLITVVVTGLLSVYLFLSSTTHAKQLKFLNSTITYCPTDDEIAGGAEVTETCTTLNATEINNEAKKMCGPFTEETSAWDMVKKDISSFPTLAQIVYEVIVNVLIVWFIVLFFFLKSHFAESSLGVAETSINEKERAFESSALANESKIRKLTKQINKLELAAQAAAGD
ncbi:hypothetical protein TrLO_g1105 [Triparma laevis f. longispina]|uniref:TMC domain-containing protein n=1 Tax=Triparma laevis f. longispina TaxID=1714387 RepID=A0A9W7FT17_9STRA|nr:hypothetical protein TrLO_g1105 [Triparma laevis f. longispina]